MIGAVACMPAPSAALMDLVRMCFGAGWAGAFGGSGEGCSWPCAVQRGVSCSSFLGELKC
jgi:hypothetical protein